MAAFPVLPFMLMGASILIAALAGVSARSRVRSSNPKTVAGQRKSKLSEIERHLQCALERASEAEAYAQNANVGDRNTRLAQAEQAQYQATAARQAADRATAAADGGSSGELDYAAQARGAADRAQAGAERARYNASLA